MHLFTYIFFFSGLVPLAFAGYSLKDDYSADKFFDLFGFDTVTFTEFRGRSSTDKVFR